MTSAVRTHFFTDEPRLECGGLEIEIIDGRLHVSDDDGTQEIPLDKLRAFLAAWDAWNERQI